MLKDDIVINFHAVACFQVYEWALETMQYLNAVNSRTTKVTAKVTPQPAIDETLCKVQQFVSSHPSPLSDVQVECQMNDWLLRVNSPRLDQLWTTARQRSVHVVLEKTFHFVIGTDLGHQTQPGLSMLSTAGKTVNNHRLTAFVPGQPG